MQIEIPTKLQMTQTDTQRSILRPYYEPSNFQMDYTAKFDPNIGVLDFQNKNLASKLSILSKSSNFINSNYNNNNGSNLNLGFDRGNFMANKLSRSYSSGSDSLFFGVNLLNFKQWFQWKQWDKFLWSFVLIPYGKQILLQPLENIRTLMQISEANTPIVTRTETEFKSIDNDKNNSNHNQYSNKSDDRNLIPDEEIDFFPIYTRMKHESMDQKPIEPNSFEPMSNVNWENEYESSTQLCNNNGDEVPYNNNIILSFNKLDTWEMFNIIKENRMINWKYLWRSINYSFIYKILNKFSYNSFNKIIYQLSSIWLPSYWINNTLRLSFIVKNLSQFITTLCLLPFELIKLKQICILRPIDKPIDWSQLIQFDKLDNNLLIAYCLQLAKILIKNSLDFTLELIIYYKLNLPTITNNQTILLTCLLRLIVQLLQLSVRLPLDTLIKRYQLQFLITGNHSTNSIYSLPRETMIVKRTNKLWSGLWFGWKINLMSRICQFSVNLMNQINDDIALERF